MFRIIMLGAPGVGKGTHATALSEEFGVVHISSGDIFRETVKSGTELALTLKSYMDRGELIPDGIVNDMIIARLKQADCAQGFILDGYPRTLNQAEIFDIALQEAHLNLDFVVNLVASEEMIKTRLTGRRICRDCGANYHVTNIPPKVAGICDQCGGELYQRDDDKAETISHRLTIYTEQTAGLISYYEKKGLLRTVDAEIDREHTYNDIVSLVKQKA